MKLASINVFETSTTQTQMLGFKYCDEFGDIWRYTLAGGVTLNPGQLVVNADSDTDATNVTVAQDYTTGQTSLFINAAGAIAQDYFVDGSVSVNDGTGEGTLVYITGNTQTSGAGVMEVSLKDPLPVNLTASTSEVTLQKSPWDSVVISAVDQADMPVGVPQVSIPAGNYGWVKTRGSASVLADEIVTKGAALTTGSSTAGSVEALDAAGEFQIGVAQRTLVDGEYVQAFLTID